MQQALGSAKAYRPLHCANVAWVVRTHTRMHTQHCWGITQPPPGASDSQTGSSGRGGFPAALKILAGVREGGREERREWRSCLRWLTSWIFPDRPLRACPQKCRSIPCELLSITRGIWGQRHKFPDVWWTTMLRVSQWKSEKKTHTNCFSFWWTIPWGQSQHSLTL